MNLYLIKDSNLYYKHATVNKYFNIWSMFKTNKFMKYKEILSVVCYLIYS